MGTKVPFDICSICGNRAKTRKEYCIHASKYLGEIIAEDLAKKWSIQTGKKILPGTQVYVINTKPRFFDISKVYIGADRTSYVLGKAASKATRVTSSLDLAEAYEITDDIIDKAASVRKAGEIEKEIGGALGPKDVDGQVSKTEMPDILSKAVKEKVNKSIVAEPILPRELLDGIAKTRSLSSIFSTLLGLGIFPKPVEVQRIVLVHIGKKPLADELDKNNEVFDYTSDEPADIPVDNFDDSLSRVLIPYLAERSACPSFLLPRLEYLDKQSSLDKYAFYSSTMGKDYWIDPNPKIGLPQPSMISPSAKALAGIAAVYAGLKAKSLGIGPERMANIFVNKPWLAALIGGSVMYNIYKAMAKSGTLPAPASAYEGRLQSTNFTGHVKAAAGGADLLLKRLGRGVLVAGAAFPGAYFLNAAQQKSLRTTGRPMFSMLPTYSEPQKAALTAGALTAVTPMVISALKRK